jgi:hypothetical protein
MTDIAELARAAHDGDNVSEKDVALWTAIAEIKRLRDEIGRLRTALMPFAKNANAISLTESLGHISREDLERAKEVLR